MTIFLKTTSAEDRVALLEKYDVRILFIQNFDMVLFEEMIDLHPASVERIEVGGITILKIEP